MTNKLINNYAILLSKIKTIEKEIQERFMIMVRPVKADSFRCRDYCRRNFDLLVFFDHLNINFFKEENIKEMRDIIVEFDKLRIEQKNMELKIDKLKANDLLMQRHMR